MELDIDEYFDHIEQPDNPFKPGIESLRELNVKFGFPDKSGAML